MLNPPSGIGWNSVTTTGPSGAPELARGSGGDNIAVIEAHVTGGPMACSQALLPQAHQAAQAPSRHRRHASDTFASAAGQLLYGHRMPSSLPNFGPELQNTGGKSDVSLPSCPAPILEEPLIQALHDGSLFDFLAEEGAEDARPMLDADEDLFVLPSPQAVDTILGGVGVHSIPSHSGSSAASLQQSVLAACGGRSVTTALATSPPAAQTLEGSQVSSEP